MHTDHISAVSAGIAVLYCAVGIYLYQVQRLDFLLWISRYRRWLFWESRNSFADSAMPGDMDYRYDWYLCSILCGKVEKYRIMYRNNLPFRGDEYRAILRRFYPKKNWNRIRFSTNFTVDSPCVMGIFHHTIAFKTLNYSIEDIEIILMHESTHIVRKDNFGKKIAMVIVLINWFNPVLRFYLEDLDAWGDISCDIHVCSRFLGGHARKYFDLLWRFSQMEEQYSENLPAFVSKLNSEQSLGKRVEYMIRWQKAGKKTGVSVLLALTLVIGSSVTAFASSVQVASQQNNLYCKTRVQEVDVVNNDDLQEYVIPADQVDEEKWDNAIVYDDALLEPLSIQRNFDWKIPGNNFARSIGFIKKGRFHYCCFLLCI